MNIDLTVVIPNRDRLCLESHNTKLLIESLCKQINKQFQVMIVDGGSKNYESLKDYVCSIHSPKFTMIQHILEDKWNKTILNNIGIQSADTPYVLTTDADMFFAPMFFQTVISLLNPKEFLESRTFYWIPAIMENIYNKSLNPYDNIKDCMIGRIKKRTTCGGCQCGHKSIWEEVCGFDQRYEGWGSEDVDLLRRVEMAGFPVRWIGEHNDVMLFHQPHNKISVKQDMQDQNKNLEYYHNIKDYRANPNGWGKLKQEIRT